MSEHMMNGAVQFFVFLCIELLDRSNSRDGFEHKLWGKMSVTAEMSQKDEKIIMVHVSALGSDGPKVSEIVVLHNSCGVCARFFGGRTASNCFQVHVLQLY
jgi:hypothetical protein